MTERGPQPSSPSQASLEAQVARAELVVHKNKAASETLHGQWKTHLFHLSFLLMFVGLQQLQTRLTPCLKEIKRYNHHQSSLLREGISGTDALRISLLDALHIVACLAMTVFLTRFLSSRRHKSRASFSTSFSYMTANALVLVILGLSYWQGRGHASDKSCVADLLSAAELEPSPEAASNRSISFPVVLIFHVIVTASVWFMDVQARQHEKNVQLVEKLRADLLPEDETTLHSHNLSTTKETKKRSAKDKDA